MPETHSALSETIVPTVDSTALARLIAEVSMPSMAMNATSYNRTYNRHNR